MEILFIELNKDTAFGVVLFGIGIIICLIWLFEKVKKGLSYIIRKYFK